ncbi:hypothetical protein ACJRO7_004539 [Eucalyptus globulus]|uniref:Uncharacterized protein n=1 Tax=Eucalyptus globulus TaxID=34317 RepID=A0ABD3IZN7_EUCGL
MASSQTVIKSLENDITELNNGMDDEWHRGEMMLGIFISAVGLILGHVRSKGLQCHHFWMPLVVVVAMPFVLMFLKKVDRITRLKVKLGHKKEWLQHFKQVESLASPAQASTLEQHRQEEEAFEAVLEAKCMICT